MRILCHMEKITAIDPIQGADAIEVATILGWKVVIAKVDNFKVGDLVVYIEIDSVLPERPEFEKFRTRKFRIRTIKLRGQVSQGLVLPLAVLPVGKYKEGQDVTELIGATHYDPESPLHTDVEKEFTKRPFVNKILKFLFNYWIFRKLLLPLIRKEKGGWPQWFSKTDEPRIQGMPSILEKHKDKVFYVTEKCDGQSSTFFVKNVKKGIFTKLIFGVLSRNNWLKTPHDCNWWNMARKYNLEKVLTDYYNETGREICIQGECIGPGIQKNKYELKELELRVFNVMDLEENYHFDSKEMVVFCEKTGLTPCPILDMNFKLPETVKEMVDYAEGKSVLNQKTIREGVVIRCIENGEKLVSFKAINNNFLLKHEE
jgi:hypothetical protein